MILGVDLSKFQGEDGWPVARFQAFHNAGVQFAICRASLGTTYRDPSFAVNRERATALGWVVGGYHFLYRGDAVQQATVFVDALGVTADCLAVVDVEAVKDHPEDSPRWLDVVEFIARFRKLVPGHPIGIYANPGYWAGNNIDNAPGKAVADYLWLAKWTGDQALMEVALPTTRPEAKFGTWLTAQLWQWGHYLPSGVDGDAWYGSLDALAALGKEPDPDAETKAYERGRVSGLSTERERWLHWIASLPAEVT
jgi:GH25 family lysozyme M1 (1,4-beta-N-acetylmuramidase)